MTSLSEFSILLIEQQKSSNLIGVKNTMTNTNTNTTATETETAIVYPVLTKKEKDALDRFFPVIEKTEVKKFSAKLSAETLTLLTELDIIENGTAIYRFFQMACKRKLEIECETTIDKGEFDTIAFQLKNNRIELALPVFVQNKIALMPKKVLATYKKSESAKFKLLRRFYREATDERVLDLVFNVQTA